MVLYTQLACKARPELLELSHERDLGDLSDRRDSCPQNRELRRTIYQGVHYDTSNNEKVGPKQGSGEVRSDQRTLGKGRRREQVFLHTSLGYRIDSVYDASKINELKGKITSDFAFIERAISVCIASYYAKDWALFTEEILENDFFSFELKKRILGKLLKKHFPEYIFPWAELARLQQLRNLASHGAITAVPNEQGGHTVYLRHQGKNHSITKLKEEFESIKVVVDGAVDTLPGVEWTRNDVEIPAIEL